jgi:hypothetical protein
MRRILLAMTLSAMPALAWAASSAGGPPVEGMPQLAFGHPVQGPLLIGQVVWQVIIFFALFMLMAFVALPRLGAVIENRRQRIEGDLDAAPVYSIWGTNFISRHYRKGIVGWWICIFYGDSGSVGTARCIFSF